MKVFAQRALSEFLDEQKKALIRSVHSENANRLLNVNETEYVDYLVHQFTVEPLVFDFDNTTVSEREGMIPAERFPSDFFVRSGQHYPRHIITYHVPYSGCGELLACTPSSYILWTTEVQVKEECVSFDIINWRNDAEDIKREAGAILTNMRRQAESVAAEVGVYNRRLAEEAPRVVQERKAELLRRANVLASLDVGIRKREGVSGTFAVPIQRKPLIIKSPPEAPTTPFAPEPTLDESVYEAILEIIHDAGVEMERHPNVYRDKSEEVLRDHFIMILSPHFQSVTGETFNRGGKVDILIRHEKSNVFVAECKFWRGVKEYFEAINQLFGYLTWRDSKAALLCFVRNKEFSPVLATIEAEAPKHPYFVKYHGRKAEHWFSYGFHLPDDHTRAVSVAVLCFHFPEI